MICTAFAIILHACVLAFSSPRLNVFVLLLPININITLMADKKRVLKEFEWFEVQTKVRQILAEVIEPLEKRLLSNTHSISKLQTRSEVEQKKVQYLTLMLNNDPNIFEHGIFANIESKIKETSIHSKQLQAKVAHLQSFIEKKVQLLEGRLRESSEMLQGLREFKRYVDEEISNQNSKLVQSQLSLHSNFEQINRDISACMLRVEDVRQLHLAAVVRLEDFDNRHGERQSKLEESTSAFSSALRDATLKLEFQGTVLAELQEEIRRVNRFEKHTRQLEAKIEYLGIAVDNVEYKAEVLQPIVALTQINEYAHHILPGEYRNNISIYYHNRYRQMVEQIIAGQLSREEKREQVLSTRKLNLELVKQVHKRAIKCVFKVKKHKLAEQGIDIDSLTHDRKEELLNGMHLHEEFSDVAGAKSVPEKDEGRGKLRDEDYKELREQLAKDLRARVEQELKDSKNYIIEMEDLMRKEMEQMQGHLFRVERSAQETHQNLELEGRLLVKLEQQLANAVALLQKEDARILECLRNINSVLSVHQMIEKQDERDRLAIALLGVKETHRDEVKESHPGRRTPVQLSPNCLSCSGNANYYNQFFKMACLNYTSSPIKFNNELISRIDLLEKTQLELHKVAQTLDPTHPHPHSLSKSLSQSLSKQQGSSAGQEKMDRYESQIMGLPSRNSQSASDSYMIRNVSTSQEVRGNKLEKAVDSPRVINANELVENLLSKNANRLFNRKRDGLRDYKRKKESSSRQSRERSEYMINVSSYFKELRKQNQSFIK